jgi:RHS repeat-associated protein
VACYVYSDGMVVARVDGGGKASFYHGDKTGSVLALTDEQGRIATAYAYDPYGAVTSAVGDDGQPFTFVGQHGVERDTEALYLMGARHYHAGIGRFLQKDPIGFAAGTNLYAYASGDPVGRIDPAGTYDYMGDPLPLPPGPDGLGAPGYHIGQFPSSPSTPPATSTPFLQTPGATTLSNATNAGAGTALVYLGAKKIIARVVAGAALTVLGIEVGPAVGVAATVIGIGLGLGRAYSGLKGLLWGDPQKYTGWGDWAWKTFDFSGTLTKIGNWACSPRPGADPGRMPPPDVVDRMGRQYWK